MKEEALGSDVRNSSASSFILNPQSLYGTAAPIFIPVFATANAH